MRDKTVTESELFKKLNILLLDKNKEHLEVIKERMSLLANVEIDNSGFIRGTIEYFYENQDQLKILVDHIKDYKGYNVLRRFQELISENASCERISDELGIGVDISKKTIKRINEV